MTALTDWLLAQIAADEKNAWRWLYDDAEGLRREPVDHVLDTCVAHRKIVELHTPLAGEECDPACGDIYPACDTLRAIASIYRGRPGWQEDWA